MVSFISTFLSIMSKLLYSSIKLWLGEFDDDLNFAYEHNTEVLGSCAATLDGEMFVLGGYHSEYKKQVNIKNRLKLGHLLVRIVTGLNKMNLF